MKLSMEKMQERLSRLMYTQEESDREMQLLRGELQDIRSSESQAWKVEQEVSQDMWRYQDRLSVVESECASQNDCKNVGADSFVPVHSCPPGLKLRDPNETPSLQGSCDLGPGYKARYLRSSLRRTMG
eukprot:1507273-Amphidinium_carterae.2